jgi:hypothetical protein
MVRSRNFQSAAASLLCFWISPMGPGIFGDSLLGELVTVGCDFLVRPRFLTSAGRIGNIDRRRFTFSRAFSRFFIALLKKERSGRKRRLLKAE